MRAAILAPPRFLDLLANGGMYPAQVEAAMGASFRRVMLLFGALTAAAAATAVRVWRW